MMMRFKYFNGTCFYIISFSYRYRKDFEQAYTVGHKKKRVLVVQYYSHQQKSYSGFKCLEI